MTEKIEEVEQTTASRPGPRVPKGGVAITAKNQKEIAPLVSVYCGPEPDRAYREWIVLDSRGRGAVISEWFELRQVTPDLLAACEMALKQLTLMGVNQRQGVMVALKAAIAKAEGDSQ